MPLRPHWLAHQLKCQSAFEDVGRQVRPALATERALRDDPARGHRLDRGRDVLSASLATENVVAHLGWRQVEHGTSIGEQKAKVKIPPRPSIFPLRRVGKRASQARARLFTLNSLLIDETRDAQNETSAGWVTLRTDMSPVWRFQADRIASTLSRFSGES